DHAQTYWWIVAGAVIAAAIGLKYAAQTETGRWRLDTVRLRIAGFGRVVKSLAIARFCRILGTLLTNGVPILPSPRHAKDATGTVVLSRAIEEAADNLSEGKSLAKPLSQGG